jgi:hypothetical protein
MLIAAKELLSSPQERNPHFDLLSGHIDSRRSLQTAARPSSNVYPSPS